MLSRIFRLILILILISCGHEEPPLPQSEWTTVILPRNAEELDPRFVRDPYGLKISRLLFGSLITIDPRTLEVVPELAHSVERSADGIVYHIVLRDGLRFSDGSSLDARDVVETFRGILSDQLSSRYAGTYRRISEIEIRSPLEVQITLNAPHATFLTDLEMPIVRAEDAYHRMGINQSTLIGAGPYRLLGFDSNRLELEANSYWHRGEPLHQRIRFLTVQDDNTRALRLLAGAGDVAVNAIPPLLLPMFEEDPQFEIRSVPGVGTTYLGFYTPSIPVLVRRAIAHAIDRQTLIETKLEGRARPTESWIPDGHWAATTLLPYDYDRQKARALLDQAGWLPNSEGVRKKLILRVSSDRFRLSVSRAISAMLKEVGLNVVLRPSESATLISDLNAGRFDMCLLQVPEVFEPHLLSWFFSSQRIPSSERYGANRWRFVDIELDAALERGRIQGDLEERRHAYREVQQILHEKLPVFPLWQEDTVVVVRKGRQFDAPRDGRFGTFAY